VGTTIYVSCNHVYDICKHACLYCVQCKERAEQVAYKLEQDLALCEYVFSYSMSVNSSVSIFMLRNFIVKCCLQIN